MIEIISIAAFVGGTIFGMGAVRVFTSFYQNREFAGLSMALFGASIVLLSALLDVIYGK